MITGVVTKDLEVTVLVILLDAAGRTHQITGAIDTGYNGSLTLPQSLVTAFGLPLLYSQTVRLADGSTRLLPVHAATLDGTASGASLRWTLPTPSPSLERDW